MDLRPLTKLQARFLFWGVVAYAVGLLAEGEHLSRIIALPIEFASGLGEAAVIATAVSYLYDVAYHRDAFIRPIEKATQLVEHAEVALKRVDRRVDNLTHVLGYVDFHAHIMEAYGGARRRIVSVSDYWPIDEEWSSHPSRTEAWEASKLYQQLDKAFARSLQAADLDEFQDGTGRQESFGSVPAFQSFSGGFPLYVTFAGRVPICTNDTNALLTPQDFRRFLGIAWRLVIASRVRRSWRRRCQNAFFENTLSPEVKRKVSSEMTRRGPDTTPHSVIDSVHVPVRVLVATIPIGLTIVDDEVLLRFDDSVGDKDVFDTRGTLLDVKPDQRRASADAYSLLVTRYMSHSRSAREYVQSCLVMSNLLDVSSSDKSRLLSESTSNEVLLKSLNRLGLTTWASYEASQPSGRRLFDLPVAGGDHQFRLRAMDIMTAFVRTTSMRKLASGVEKSERFRDLRGVLA